MCFVCRRFISYCLEFPYRATTSYTKERACDVCFLCHPCTSEAKAELQSAANLADEPLESKDFEKTDEAIQRAAGTNAVACIMEVMIEPSGTSASKRTSILAELRELRSRAAPKTEVDLFPGAIVKAAKAALASN
jgi:hypothetical protein